MKSILFLVLIIFLFLSLLIEITESDNNNNNINKEATNSNKKKKTQTKKNKNDAYDRYDNRNEAEYDYYDDDNEEQGDEEEYDNDPNNPLNQESEYIITLNSQNFDEIINHHKYVMVEFYAPWCTHCKEFAPEYELAASQLSDPNQNNNNDIVLCKMDATNRLNEEIAIEYEIEHYPTIIFFNNHDFDFPVEYNDELTVDALIEWIKIRLQPALFILNSIKDIQSFLEYKMDEKQRDNNIVLIAYMNSSIDVPLEDDTKPENVMPDIDDKKKNKKDKKNKKNKSKLSVNNEKNRKVLSRIAEMYRDYYPIAFVNDSKLIELLNSNEYKDQYPIPHEYNAIYLYKQFKENRNRLEMSKYNGDIHKNYDDNDMENLHNFINVESFPLIGEINEENFADYSERGLPYVWIIHFPKTDLNKLKNEMDENDNNNNNDTHKKILELELEIEKERQELIDVLIPFASDLKSNFSFVWIDGFEYDEFIEEYLGIKRQQKKEENDSDSDKKQKKEGDEIPTIIDYTPYVVIEKEDESKYLLKGDNIFDGIQVKEFFNKFKDGTLEKYIKSQPVPTEVYEDNVYVLVGSTFDDVVGKDKDVLVEYYAPWCGYCKAFAPEYAQVGDVFKEVNDLIIAKIDATANDVSEKIDGFPTVIFYPKGQNVPNGVEYENLDEENELVAFTAEPVVEWIKKHATVNLDLHKASYNYIHKELTDDLKEYFEEEEERQRHGGNAEDEDGYEEDEEDGYGYDDGDNDDDEYGDDSDIEEEDYYRQKQRQRSYSRNQPHDEV